MCFSLMQWNWQLAFVFLSDSLSKKDLVYFCITVVSIQGIPNLGYKLVYSFCEAQFLSEGFLV